MTAEPDRSGRRPVLLVIAWVATAAIAIAISGWAVGLASRQVTDPIQPAALSEIARTVGPSPVTSPSPEASPDPSPSASPAGAGGGTSSATAEPAVPPTSVRPPVGTTTTRTVSAVGGRASFRFGSGGVTLEWATPSAGFEVDVEEHSGELRVRFRGDDHESRVFASVRDGQPVTRVEERADDDGGGDDDADDRDDDA